jgi:glyoxylase-like metal-dependent hydrolase (beta-lactamase superfamily II)
MVVGMSSSGMETAVRASTYVAHLRPSLFPGGVGKTWKRGDFTQLLADVTSRMFDVYGDSTVVYPGHGDDTTLGAERPHLSNWKRWLVRSGRRRPGDR